MSSMVLPLLDFNWHFQSLISSPVSPVTFATVSSSSRSDVENGLSNSSGDHVEEFREEFRGVFEAIDENDDGMISKEEVRRLMSKLGHEISESDLELLMLSVDSNGDGYVDFDEFLSLYTNLSGLDDEEDLKEAFRIFDKNDDGFITAEELHMVLSNLGLVQAGCIMECQRMISGVDSNGDGLVDFMEFKQMMN